MSSAMAHVFTVIREDPAIAIFHDDELIEFIHLRRRTALFSSGDSPQSSRQHGIETWNAIR